MREIKKMDIKPYQKLRKIFIDMRLEEEIESNEFKALVNILRKFRPYNFVIMD